jgi:hypothetical protein
MLHTFGQKGMTTSKCLSKSRYLLVQLHNVTEQNVNVTECEYAKCTSSTTKHVFYVTLQNVSVYNRMLPNVQVTKHSLLQNIYVTTYMSYTEKCKPPPSHGLHPPAEPRLYEELVHGRHGRPGLLTLLSS